MSTPIAVAAGATSAPPGQHTSPEGSNGILGQDDFLKLMIAQLMAQNPLQPANATEYVAELAQFTQVEQITNLALNSQRASAVAMIGHKVTYLTATGTVAEGVVQGIQTDGSEPTLTVEGVPGIGLSSVKEIS